MHFPISQHELNPYIPLTHTKHQYPSYLHMLANLWRVKVETHWMPEMWNAKQARGLSNVVVCDSLHSLRIGRTIGNGSHIDIYCTKSLGTPCFGQFATSDG